MSPISFWVCLSLSFCNLEIKYVLLPISWIDRRMKLRQRGQHKAAPKRIITLFHSVNPIRSKKMEIIHEDPNVFVIDDFLSPAEILWMDKICTLYQKKFKKSFTEPGGTGECFSEERTSTFLHLSKGQDQVIRAIETRAAEMVGLHTECMEPIQIVSYKRGQYFNVHHDGGTLLESGEVDAVGVRRFVTFFVYLNSLPAGQGETVFPVLKLNVTPKRGRALLFCNVLPNGDVDKRTVHQAMPVEGDLRKFGMNVRDIGYCKHCLRFIGVVCDFSQIWIGDVNMQSLSQLKSPTLVPADFIIGAENSVFAVADYKSGAFITKHAEVSN